MKNRIITKETVSAVVSLISAICCALLAGCRFALGNMQFENLEVEFATTNLVSIIGE